MMTAGGWCAWRHGHRRSRLRQAPSVALKAAAVEEDETQVRRIWRATETTLHVPPSVIGQMTHKALELWLSVDDPRLITLLESLALGAGLATQEQRVEAVRRVRELIERFCTHPLRDEIESADERHHEVPYSRVSREFSETGYVDLLYRKGNIWYMVDFKTDSIRSDKERDELVNLYRRQMNRYSDAMEHLLGESAHLHICFLDDNGRVGIVDV
jgi:ATP-dependent exoDNAse (exonuclease V) beta subunit